MKLIVKKILNLKIFSSTFHFHLQPGYTIEEERGDISPGKNYLPKEK